MPTPVSSTPTPHYEPMTDNAYIADYDFTVPLMDEPNISSRARSRIPPSTYIEILDAVWYYEQGRYGDTYCYIYHIQVPGTELEGWLEQDGITKNKGEEVPVEHKCFQDGQPIPTPPHTPLSGSAYVNVGAGKGIVGAYTHDPRDHSHEIFAHGLQVEIVVSFWANYDAGEEEEPPILCYMYLVNVTSLDIITWLPEDVLTKELTDTPNRGCFPAHPNTAIYPISPTPPEGFEIYTPEPEP